MMIIQILPKQKDDNTKLFIRELKKNGVFAHSIEELGTTFSFSAFNPGDGPADDEVNKMLEE